MSVRPPYRRQPRRQRRVREAWEQLRRAYPLFTGVGMEAFAERARGELRAAGAGA